MGRTILAVDDENATLAILETALKGKYEVVKKRNGKEALEWMHQGNLPCAIVSDLNMPVMDGFNFIRQVKTSGFFRDIPLLILSCHETSNIRIDCLRCGADDFLMKPFNPEELHVRIENILKRVEVR